MTLWLPAARNVVKKLYVFFSFPVRSTLFPEYAIGLTTSLYANRTVRLPPLLLPAHILNPQSKEASSYLCARVPKGVLFRRHKQGHWWLAQLLG
jgi:hypothetical protein